MAMCQSVCETKYTCAREGPWGNGVRVLAVLIAGVYLLLLSPSCLLLLSRGTSTGRGCSQNSCPLPWHLALRALGGPYLLWLERDRPRQVHKLTFPPPLSFWGQAGSVRPRGRAGPPGSEPPHPASILLERAPAGCDWLIQTHRHRNACLRVPVGVQFKSAALGARGRAGAGSADDSCAEAAPGRPLAF